MTSNHDVLKVIQKLHGVAQKTETALYLFGGVTLCAYSGIEPKDVDFLVLTPNIDRFIDQIKADFPIQQYQCVVDYEDSTHRLQYPGRLDRFLLGDVSVDITSRVTPISDDKELEISSEFIIQKRQPRYYGCPSLPPFHSLIYCLFRSEIGSNDDKRREVDCALEGIIGGENVTAVVPGVLIKERTSYPGVKSRRYEVGLRGSRLMMSPLR